MKIPENNDYLKGTKPFSWNGSVPILQQWYNGRCRPVRYGYCGSLASVMCTGIFQPAFTYLSKVGERKLDQKTLIPKTTASILLINVLLEMKLSILSSFDMESLPS